MSRGKNVSRAVHNERDVPCMRSPLRTRTGVLSGRDVHQLGARRHLPGGPSALRSARVGRAHRNRRGRCVRTGALHGLRSRCIPVFTSHLCASERAYQAVTGLALIVLVCADVVGLILIPFGLPGLWIMMGGILAYGWLTDFRSVGVATIVIALAIAFFGEILDNWLGFRFAKRYGGSAPSGWGGLLRGLVGAGIGVPIPLFGRVIRAFIGAFAGPAVFEHTYYRHGD